MRFTKNIIEWFEHWDMNDLKPSSVHDIKSVGWTRNAFNRWASNSGLSKVVLFFCNRTKKIRFSKAVLPFPSINLILFDNYSKCMSNSYVFWDTYTYTYTSGKTFKLHVVFLCRLRKSGVKWLFQRPSNITAKLTARISLVDSAKMPRQG